MARPVPLRDELCYDVLVAGLIGFVSDVTYVKDLYELFD